MTTPTHSVHAARPWDAAAPGDRLHSAASVPWSRCIACPMSVCSANVALRCDSSTHIHSPPLASHRIASRLSLPPSRSQALVRCTALRSAGPLRRLQPLASTRSTRSMRTLQHTQQVDRERRTEQTSAAEKAWQRNFESFGLAAARSEEDTSAAFTTNKDAL
jgi:hypothetical protein